MSKEITTAEFNEFFRHVPWSAIPQTRDELKRLAALIAQLLATTTAEAYAIHARTSNYLDEVLGCMGLEPGGGRPEVWCDCASCLASYREMVAMRQGRRREARRRAFESAESQEPGTVQ